MIVENREPTYTALTNDERELQRLGILGTGVYDAFHSVQDAVTQMQDWIAELEKERDMLRGLLTSEQLRIAYPGPAEWMEENEMEITLESIAKYCIDDNITAEQIYYLLKVQAEVKRLRRIEEAIKAIRLPEDEAPVAWHIREAAIGSWSREFTKEWLYGIADALEVK